MDYRARSVRMVHVVLQVLLGQVIICSQVFIMIFLEWAGLNKVIIDNIHLCMRYILFRRTEDDTRQIRRWKNCCGPKGRWKVNLIGKIARAGAAYDNDAVSPVVRQTLQHWAYRLTENDYKVGKNNIKM